MLISMKPSMHGTELLADRSVRLAKLVAYPLPVMYTYIHWYMGDLSLTNGATLKHILIDRESGGEGGMGVEVTIYVVVLSMCRGRSGTFVSVRMSFLLHLLYSCI